MNKLGISNLIKFRRKETDKTKQTFASNLFKPKEENDGGGGDYWITSTSAIENTFRDRNISFLDAKVDELQLKIDETEHKTVKDQFKRNISILTSMRDFDFDVLYPESELRMLRKPKTRGIVSVEGINLQARPRHVFTWSRDGIDYVGAVWFVAVKDGYTQKELGIFSDLLYRYLKQEFGDSYVIDSEFCLVVDTVKAQELAYARLESGDVSKELILSLRDLKRFIPVSI